MLKSRSYNKVNGKATTLAPARTQQEAQLRSSLTEESGQSGACGGAATDDPFLGQMTMVLSNAQSTYLHVCFLSLNSWALFAEWKEEKKIILKEQRAKVNLLQNNF